MSERKFKVIVPKQNKVNSNFSYPANGCEKFDGVTSLNLMVKLKGRGFYTIAETEGVETEQLTIEEMLEIYAY